MREAVRHQLLVAAVAVAVFFTNLGVTRLWDQDEAFFDALVRMFEQALGVIGQLPAPDSDVLIARLDRVRVISHNFGYGVGDDMDSLLARYAGT